MDKRLSTAVLAALAASLAACSSGGSDDGLADNGGGTGTLSVGLIDKPVQDAVRVCLDIEQVNVKPEEGPAFEFVYEPAPLGEGETAPCDGDQTDLLALTDPDRAAMLLEDQEVAAGRYEWIEIVVNAEFDGSTSDSYVQLETDGSFHELRVPSGSVRLVSGFDVAENELTWFTIDWNVRSALVNPPGQPGLLLRPAFRIIDMSSPATLSGTIDPAVFDDEANECFTDDESDADVGNVVYVYAALGETAPDDIDGIDPEPLTTVEVDQNAGVYTYRTLLSPGDYSVAFTCEAENDVPPDDTADNDDDIVFLGPVDISLEDGGAATVDFPVAEAPQ